MRIEHHGLTVELADDDPRAAIIQTVLFGGPIPPPPGQPFAAPVPATAAAPADSPHAARLWAALAPPERQELVALAQRERTPPELERLLGLSQPALLGQHSRMARLCKAYGVALTIRSRGRGRERRRYWVNPQTAELVNRLAAAHGVEG